MAAPLWCWPRASPSRSSGWRRSRRAPSPRTWPAVGRWRKPAIASTGWPATTIFALAAGTTPGCARSCATSGLPTLLLENSCLRTLATRSGLAEHDQVAAGILEGDHRHVDGLGGLAPKHHAEPAHASELGIDVVDGERRQRDALLEQCLLERLRGRVL